jgi:hypothetical protein
MSPSKNEHPRWWHFWQFHGLLNIGRVISYVLVGGGMGALGSVMVAGGQLAGIDSYIRRGIAIATGLLMIAFGLSQIRPKLLPKIPIIRKVFSSPWHNNLSRTMVNLSLKSQWWTPALLGMLWGLIPCGFLYTAQIKAAQTSSVWGGSLTMLMFGLGIMPVMIGLGVSASSLSTDRRSQLYRMGGWITIAIGILLLFRNSNMVDFSGHAALFMLMLALIARPISRFWSSPLRYRRLLGVGAFILALIHTAYMLDHTFNWNLAGLGFMLPTYQTGIWLGIGALALMTPAAITSFNSAERSLGKYWRLIHLLAVPALIVCTLHTVLVGSFYLGNLNWSLTSCLLSCGLISLTIIVLLMRSRWIWSLLSLSKYYVLPSSFPKSK